jgi:subfamily B ATP-binding cassette protein MsbA
MKYYLRILSFAKPYLGYAGLNALFNILMTIFSLFSIGALMPILDLIFGEEILADPNNPIYFSFGTAKDWAYYHIGIWILQVGKVSALAYVCIISASSILLKNISAYLSLYFIAPLRNGVINDIRAAVHKKCLELPISYFNDKRKGDLLTRLTSDVAEIEWTILNSLEMIFREPLNIVISLMILIWMSPSLTLFVFLVLPISGLIISVVGKSLKRSSRKAQHQLGFVMSLLEETLGGVRIIKAFNAEKTAQSRFSKSSSTFARLMNKVNRKKDASSPISETLGVTVVLLIIWFGGKQVFAGEMSKGSLISFIAFFYMIIPSFKKITDGIFNIQKGNASSERILEILDTYNPIQELANPEPLNSFEKEIEFKNVSFQYDKDGTKVLKNINFSIPKGKTVALVGSSGSGKTTISNLLPRFYDSSEGVIAIDGKDIKAVGIKNLRGLMGIVSQESILFNDSIRNNIALGNPDAPLEEVINAAKVANAHEFIDKMESGYDQNIGERGNKLSGGQKQRMSIARALLSDPPILILDEATSALDTESEKLVQEALNHLMQNRTSLIIAHRLSTIQHADVILVMENGEIVERGRHQELLDKKGTYHKLVKMQSLA